MHEDNQEISAGHLGAYVDIYWGLAFDDAWGRGDQSQSQRVKMI
jgi:hypothetical protein